MRAKPTHPASDPLDFHALARTLGIASAGAARSWNVTRRDVYHCLSRAWRAAATPVPYAALCAVVAHELHRDHPEMSLMDFNDLPGRQPDDVASLFTAAAHRAQVVANQAPRLASGEGSSVVHPYPLTAGSRVVAAAS